MAALSTTVMFHVKHSYKLQPSALICVPFNLNLHYSCAYIVEMFHVKHSFVFSISSDCVINPILRRAFSFRTGYILWDT